MSEQKQDHGTLIKTPRQLVIVIALAFIVPIAIAVLASQLVTAGRKGGQNPETTAALIQPVAKVEVKKAAAGAPAGAKTGEQVYQATCAACHSSGAAGAPKTGDNAGWAPRLSLGLDGLTKSAIAGKNAMPPKGGNPELTDAEIARAIVFMANQSGANFQEPAAQ